MICQTCGIEAPTRSVQFHKHTGMLVVMQHGHIGGKLCKNCIGKYFAQYTGWTAVAGWWGLISFFVTPCVLLWNTGLFLSTLGLEAPAPGSAPPELTEEVVEKLAPYSERLFSQLGGGRPHLEVAREIAALAGVTPAQVLLYVSAVVEASKQS